MSRQVLGAAVLGLVTGMVTISGTRGIKPKSERGVTGEEVAEIGDDYLAVKSVAGIETHIPVPSIKSAVRLAAK